MSVLVLLFAFQGAENRSERINSWSPPTHRALFPQRRLAVRANSRRAVRTFTPLSMLAATPSRLKRNV